MISEQDTSGLARQATQGVLWTGGGQVIRQILQVSTTIALARLLLPDDFGLMGMAMVAVGVGQLFANFGIGSALVQAQDLDESVLSSAFWINVVMTGLLMAALILGAGLVGRFYDSTHAEQVVRVLAVTLLFGGLAAVPQAILYRRMDFLSVSKAQVLGTLCGSIVAVALAWFGFGVWSLVAQPIVGTAATTAMLWYGSRWWPRFQFHWQGVRALVRFGLNLLGTNLLNYANRNADKAIVGRVLGNGPLGYYSLAYQLMLYPLEQISSVIVRVLFPTLSNLQNDLPRFREAYLRATEAVAMFTVPLMLGLFVLAHEFIVVVFGENWLPMEVVLRVLAIVGLMQSISTTVGTIYLSLGRVSIAFRLALIFTPILLIAFIVGVEFGIDGVAIGYLIVNILSFFVVLVVAFKIGGIQWSLFLRRLVPIMFCGIIMGIVVEIFRSLVMAESGPVSTLVVGIAVGVICYMSMSILFNRKNTSQLFATLRQAVSR